jgi:hypothetical protein
LKRVRVLVLGVKRGWVGMRCSEGVVTSVRREVRGGEVEKSVDDGSGGGGGVVGG